MAMLLMMAGGVRAHADAALLMEEPYGLFGGINPTGHAAVYLNHVCADSPTHLRVCRAGELGVVISRYHKVGGYDWLAIPLVPYLYAVEQVDDVPSTANAALVAKLRDDYRRRHLEKIVPDVPAAVAAGEEDAGAAGGVPKGDWIQLVGASYDRKIYGFQIETSREADEHFIAEYNDKRNVSHFNLFFRNCADFSRSLLNLYYPHSIRRNYFVDLGITTPKQVARSLSKYAKRNPDLDFSTFVVPQVPGTIDRSHRINGVVEAMLRSKKYVVPLVVLNPQLTAGMIVAYLADGRFTPPKDAAKELVPGAVASTIPSAVPSPVLSPAIRPVPVAISTSLAADKTDADTAAGLTEPQDQPSSTGAPQLHRHIPGAPASGHSVSGEAQ